MSPLQLFVVLSGLAVTVVLGQNPEGDFGNPPPLPTEGTFLRGRSRKIQWGC